MTEYKGHFNVVNGTTSDITNWSVSHKCSDTTDLLSDKSLPQGAASASHECRSYKGHNDEWTISFERGGKTYSRSNKQCNMPNVSGQTCTIIFYDDSFSVVTPDTSPCMNNHY